MDTFVVRIRQPSESETGVRGIVDEVASGFRSTFHSPEELLKILTRQAPETDPKGAANP